MNMSKDSSAIAASQQNIKVTTPYGTLHIEDILAAQDHASMRAKELHAFLVLITREGGLDSFGGLNCEMQNNLLWMASRAVGEIDELLSQVDFAERKVSK
jgi:hypothetical protein